ncbi:unnamed protein product [Eruca vesicaria subsp. sativa]|uniref:DUF8204 domain-containing protein n=1 Tax=Eruca vesicaria subsp. sativa TaxID=29727 RepID=A0ABC8JHS6_ERUVS|nr:unnamed protein product [Eruca vesicaria subsp. sativa]
MEEEQKGRRGSVAKGRSCKGYLYYSSTLKSKDKHPRCVGIPRSLPQVPGYVVGQSEAEASKEGRTLTNFTMRRAASSNTSSVPTPIQNRNGTINPLSHSPAYYITCYMLIIFLYTLDSLDLPQHQNHRPTPNRTPTPATAKNTENGFVTRFTRNANLVASGVMKNLKRVGNFVKDHFDDSLDGYRKPPK